MDWIVEEELCFKAAAMCHKDEIKAVAVSFRVKEETLSNGARRGKETLGAVFL